MSLSSEKRTEVSCAARALFAGAVLAAAVKAEPAHADENSTLFKAVNDLCVNHTDTVDAIAAKALKMPFQASNYGSEKEGYYARQIALQKLGSGGTVVNFYAKSKRAPMNECHFASYSDDVADMAQQLRVAFDLSEPKPQSASVQLKSVGEKTIAGKPMKFELEHGFGPNQRSGAFSFTVNR